MLDIKILWKIQGFREQSVRIPRNKTISIFNSHKGLLDRQTKLTIYILV